MIIQSGVLLLLIFFNFSYCWVIGPALASTEYSKRLQYAQQMHNENKIKLLDNNKTFSVELNLEGNNTVGKATTELTNVEGYIIDDKENKGSNDSNNGSNQINKMEQVMPPEVSNKAGFVQEAMSAFIGKMEDDKTITTGKVQTRHDEFKKMAEFVLKNNLSESDVIDPWKDDIKSLGLTVNSSAILNETASKEEEWENNNTKAKLNELNINETLNNKSKNVDNISNNQVNVIHIRLHIKPEETFAERRARYCSNSLAHIMPKLRNHAPPFFVFNLSCISYNQGDENNNYCFPSKNANLYNPSLTENVWKNSEHCLDGIWKIVNSSIECLMVTGFVDSILDFSKISNLMIAKIEEEKAVENEKSTPVIRLFCNNDAITFYNALNDFEKGPPGYLDADGNVRTNEELFLKTVFVLEYTWSKGCIVVFFDSRTISPQHKIIGQLLFDDQPPKFGIRDGSNQWAASKYICGKTNRELFMREIHRMRYRNKHVPKDLGKFEEESRIVLSRKMDEEIFPVYEVTAPPPKGFFGRLWDGLFG